MNKILKQDMESIDKEVDFTKLKNKTILITGASGFIASYLVEYFFYLNDVYSELNLQVIALVRNLKKARNKFINHLEKPNFILIQHDVNNKIIVKNKVDFVLHAASLASPIHYKTNPVGTLLPNIIGTQNMLDLALEKRPISFLFFSSGEIYGNISSYSINENDYGIIDPLNSRACYALGKKAGEILCKSYNIQHNLKTKIVRLFHIYGPGMNLNDGRVYSDFIKNLLSKKNIEIKSDGKAVRSFCYLKDATVAILKVLLNGNSCEAYNIGNPKESYSIKELAKKISSIPVDYSPKIILTKQKNSNYFKSEYQLHSPCISKIKKLEWEPTTNVIDGFKRTINSFK